MGEHESVVSHTNPRVSHAAGTALDRLVQLIWEEHTRGGPCQRDGDDASLPHDSDMQVDNEENGRDADMNTGDTSAGYTSHRQAGASNTAAEQDSNCAETAMTQDLGEAHDNSTRDNEERQDVNPREEEHSQDDRHAETSPRGQNPTDGNANGDPFASRSISPTVPFTPSEWRPHSNGTAVSPTGERLQAGRDTGNDVRTSTDGEGTDLSRINREGRDSNNDATCHASTTQASPHDPHNPETYGDPSGDAANRAVDSAADDRDQQAAGEPGDSAGDENTANRSSDGRASNIGRTNDLTAHNLSIQGAGLAYARQDGGIETPNRDVTPATIPTAIPAGAADTIDTPGATDTGHANRPPDNTAPGETHTATQAEEGAASGTTARATDWPIAGDEAGGTAGVGPIPHESIDITPHPTRRPLTGGREESMARRVRTSSPTRSGETPAAHVCGWGLGTCNAEERWNICDRYILEHGTNATRHGLIQSLRNGGCTSQIAESLCRLGSKQAYSYTTANLSDLATRTARPAGLLYNH